MTGTQVVSCVPNSHLHRVTNTKSRIDTVISPDDGHIVARNMYRKEKNILTLRLLMSYIYGAPILDVSRSHTTTQHSR